MERLHDKNRLAGIKQVKKAILAKKAEISLLMLPSMMILTIEKLF